MDENVEKAHRVRIYPARDDAPGPEAGELTSLWIKRLFDAGEVMLAELLPSGKVERIVVWDVDPDGDIRLCETETE